MKILRGANDYTTFNPTSKSLVKTNFLKILMLCSVITIIAIVGYLFYRHSLPALEIGPLKFTRKQYNDLISEAQHEKVSAADAAQTLINTEKKYIAVQQLNISLISNDTGLNIAAAKYQVYDPQKLNDWQKLYALSQTIDDTILLNKKGGYSGAAYYFPFSRYFVQTVPPSTNPAFGNQDQINADKNYALEQAQQYLTGLMNKSLSDTQALQKIMNNSRLDYGFAANDSNFFQVDSDGVSSLQGDQSSQQLDASFLAELKSLKPGSFSDIKTSQIFINNSPLAVYQNKNVDVAYYFIELKNAFKANSTIDQQVATRAKTIKVVKRV